MGLDRLLCLTLNTNDSLKQFLEKILLNLMDLKKKLSIKLLSQFYIHNYGNTFSIHFLLHE